MVHVPALDVQLLQQVLGQEGPELLDAVDDVDERPLDGGRALDALDPPEALEVQHRDGLGHVDGHLHRVDELVGPPLLAEQEVLHDQGDAQQHPQQGPDQEADAEHQRSGGARRHRVDGPVSGRAQRRGCRNEKKKNSECPIRPTMAAGG